MQRSTPDQADQQRFSALSPDGSTFELEDDQEFRGYAQYIRNSHPHVGQFVVVLYGPSAPITDIPGPTSGLAPSEPDWEGRVQSIVIRTFEQSTPGWMSQVQSMTQKMFEGLEQRLGPRVNAPEDAEAAKKRDEEAAAAKKRDEEAAAEKQREEEAAAEKVREDAAAEKEREDAAAEKEREDAAVEKEREDAAAEKEREDAAVETAREDTAAKKRDEDAAAKKAREDAAAEKERAADKAAWEQVRKDPKWQSRLVDLVQPFPNPNVNDMQKQYNISANALPIHFFEPPIDPSEKQRMHCEMLHSAVRHTDRMIKRAEDFHPEHDIRVGVLRPTVSTAKKNSQPSVIELSDSDDEDAAGEDDQTAINQQIAEEIQSHTLLDTLDQRKGHLFYILAASLFKFHPEESYRDDFELEFSGLKMTLRLHQLEDIMYALIRINSEANGCFLGHIMGYGKTLLQLAVALVLYWGARLLDDIDQHPSYHLDTMNDGQRQCPSQDLWPIACPCRRSSASFWLRDLFDRRGMTLLIQPLGLLPNLKSEWKKFIDSSTAPLRLWIQHNDARVRGGFGYANTENFKEWDKHRHDTPTRSDLACNLLATTIGSYDSHIRDLAKVTDYWVEDNYTTGKDPHINTKKPKKNMSQERQLSLPFKLALQDECHLARTYDQAPQTFLRKLQCKDSKGNVHRAALVFASGTPTINSPTDMNELIHSMEGEKAVWAEDGTLKHCSWGEVQKLTKTLGRFTKKSKASVQHVKKELSSEKSDFLKAIKQQRAIIQSLMVRRQEDSKGWHGQPLRDIGISNIYDVEVGGEWNQDLLGSVKHALGKAKKENRSGKVNKATMLSGTGRIARVFADIPWLAGFMHDNPDFHATQAELEDFNDPKDSPFFKHRQAIFDGSPKLQELVKIRSRQTKDVKGLPEKLIVFSEFPIVVFLVKMVSIQASFRSGYTDSIIDFEVQVPQTGD